jgi:hypothetical protein
MNEYKRQKNLFLKILIVVAFFSGCANEKEGPSLFKALSSESTGLDFTNRLTSTTEFNLFHYMYFYNGAGIGAGDFNNDGRTDLFFSSNQGNNTLYLNSDYLKFKDVTLESKIPRDSGWSTGVSVVDINNDGLLDIYVCRVGKYQILNSSNQFLICQGINKNGVPVYLDKAAELGVNFSGFSTQASFLDYDMDGDLDMFLLNHSIHKNGTFRPRKEFIGTYHTVAGGRIYRNDGGKFTEVTREAGINSSAIGYGLGVVVSDINLDGYPDIYIGNDFHENDYLYINQRNGTFKDDLNSQMMHTSQYSMGVDAADADNDGYPEIISVDMLPADPYILKRSLGEDAYDIFNLKIGYGYNYQYTRNNLQYNRRNGMFSETGLYSSVAATDWSWASLWMDFDNDGLKDLFISNGIPKRMNDIDYINYISDKEVQQKISDKRIGETDEALISKFPQIKIPNKFFHNGGQLSFSDIHQQIEGNVSSYSNGAVFADLDNDGDLDVVVNNIDDPAILYRNNSNNAGNQSFLRIKLKGPEKNINALGSKVVVFANGGIRTYEKYPVRGFQSSMETPLHVGLENAKIDSMFLIWPDNTYQPISIKKEESVISVSYQKNLPTFDYRIISTYFKPATKPMVDITSKVDLKYLHKENKFVEFDREPLIPHMVSTEGPALSIGDINHDGREDVFIGSSKGEKSAIFLQEASGKFSKTSQPALENDSIYEDIDACLIDVNNDGYNDLVVASGGNEYYGNEEYLSPRVYINIGKSKFEKLPNAFDKLYLTASSVAPYDFNGDGFVDLFIGGRAIPFQYGAVPRSYLLQNDGKGRFKDVTETFTQDLSEIGFVTQGLWVDMDKDGDKDLVISLEWGGIHAFINEQGKFTRRIVTDKGGWWNFIVPCDINNDGNIDLIAGNLGLNSRLKASDKAPVRLYYNDFEGNGTKEQLLTYYVEGKEIPFANKSELEKQVPTLKKRFLYAADFARASVNKIFNTDKLKKADVFTANFFSNAVLINSGNMQFSIQPLPWQSQLAPYRDAIVVDANDDNLPDILMVGNYYENNIEMGRYDADFGTVLMNKGNGRFSSETINGVTITGQARKIRKITIAKKEAFVIARNNDSTVIIQFDSLLKK